MTIHGALPAEELFNRKVVADTRIVERYKRMLAANPAEGTALDRLWQTCQDNAATKELLDEYKAANGTFTKQSGTMRFIYGFIRTNGVARFGWMAMDALSATTVCP